MYIGFRYNFYKMKYYFLLLTFLLFRLSFGQGCSDAGFCTMGAMKPDQNYNTKAKYKLNSLSISQYRGKTTLSPINYTTTIEANISILDKTQVQVKLPYTYIKGNLGTSSGLGDISISATRLLHQADNYKLSFTLGAKIPTNNSTQKGDKVFTIPDTTVSRTLPMYYQTSLGSFDVVTGISLVSKKWLFAAGYQQALTRNKNDFKWGEWRDYPSKAYLEKHPRATHLLRGIDVMLRAERNWRFSRWNFSIGALPIWRITKDSRRSVNLEKEIKVDKTTGMALSILAGAGYQFNVNHGLKFIYGKKITDREVNPDGLTRHAVLSITYYANF